MSWADEYAWPVQPNIFAVALVAAIYGLHFCWLRSCRYFRDVAISLPRPYAVSAWQNNEMSIYD